MDDDAEHQQKPQCGGWYPGEAILYAIGILAWLILLILVDKAGLWLLGR